MTKYFTNNLSVINLYKKPSKKSEVVTQMIFGESFSISKIHIPESSWNLLGSVFKLSQSLINI